jgi:hypothetical protein
MCVMVDDEIYVDDDVKDIYVYIPLIDTKSRTSQPGAYLYMKFMMYAYYELHSHASHRP